MFIYKTINLITSKIYIGQHNGSYKNYLGSGVYLNRAIKKYGRNNFKKEIIEYCTKGLVIYIKNIELDLEKIHQKNEEMPIGWIKGRLNKHVKLKKS